MSEEIKDVPEHAAWKTYIYILREFHTDNIFLLIIKHYSFHLPVALGVGHDWLDSGWPKTEVNDLSSTNALLVLELNPLLIQLLARGVDILSIGAFVCWPVIGVENISANGLLSWSKSSEAFVDV